MARPVLVYDGECGFCRNAVAWFRARDTEQRVEYLARQSPERIARYPQLDAEQYQGAMQIILPDATIRSGADATSTVLLQLHGRLWPTVGRVMRWRGVRHCARIGYKIIAKNRHRLACDTGVCKK